MIIFYFLFFKRIKQQSKYFVLIYLLNKNIYFYSKILQKSEFFIIKIVNILVNRFFNYTVRTS